MAGILEGAFLRVLTVSVGCSLVLAPLLLLARRIQKRVAARTLYVVFLLVALRLAVPVGLELPEPVVTVSAPDYTLVLPAASPSPVQGQPVMGTQAPEADHAAVKPAQDPSGVRDEAVQKVREVPVGAIFGAVWAAGALGCVVWAVAAYAVAKRRLLRDSVPAGEAEAALAEHLRAELGIRRPVRLCRSRRACSPLALGLLRPVVVLPEGAQGDALELILRHELTHVRRWDVAYKVLLSLACAVHWFDPLV